MYWSPFIELDMVVWTSRGCEENKDRKDKLHIRRVSNCLQEKKMWRNGGGEREE